MYFSFLKCISGFPADIMQAVEEIIQGVAEPERVVIYKDGSYQDPRRYTYRDTVGIRYSRPAIGRNFSAGATIIVNDIGEKIPPIKYALEKAEKKISTTCSPVELKANCYISSARSLGVTMHEDPHDVYLYQMIGCKKWSISDRQSAPDTATLLCSPGDFLYMQRGTFHGARTLSPISLHLTIRTAQQSPCLYPDYLLSNLNFKESTKTAKNQSSYLDSIIRFRDNDTISCDFRSPEDMAEEKKILLMALEKFGGSKKRISEFLTSIGMADLLQNLVYAGEIRVQ